MMRLMIGLKCASLKSGGAVSRDMCENKHVSLNKVKVEIGKHNVSQ